MLFWLLACKEEAPPAEIAPPAVVQPLPAERWVVSATGTVEDLARLELERQLTSCPGRPGTWVAQIGDDGALIRLGGVAGTTPDPATTACLEAGLKARKLPGAGLVEITWADPRVGDYETRLRELLALKVGARPDGRCAVLRFTIDAEGGLLDPKIVAPSGDGELDAAAVAAAKAAELPRVPKPMLEHYPGSLELCVGGRAPGQR